MINKEIVYEKALKYLAMLKQGKTIKTAPLLLDLKQTMEQINSLLYEERGKGSERRDIRYRDSSRNG